MTTRDDKLRATLAGMRERAYRLRNGSAEVQPIADYLVRTAERIEAALAEPAAEGVTEEEVMKLAFRHASGGDGCDYHFSPPAILRFAAALTLDGEKK